MDSGVFGQRMSKYTHSLILFLETPLPRPSGTCQADLGSATRRFPVVLYRTLPAPPSARLPYHRRRRMAPRRNGIPPVLRQRENLCLKGGTCDGWNSGTKTAIFLIDMYMQRELQCASRTNHLQLAFRMRLVQIDPTFFHGEGHNPKSSEGFGESDVGDEGYADSEDFGGCEADV